MHGKSSYLMVGDMKRGHVATTVSLCGMPGFCEALCCGDKILSPQYAAWNSAGLNSCFMKQGQSDLPFNFVSCELLLQTVPEMKLNQYLLGVHQLVYHPGSPIYVNTKGFYPPNVPQHVPYCVPNLNYQEFACFFFNEAKGCAIPEVKQWLTEQN